MFLVSSLNPHPSPTYFYIWLEQSGATLSAQTGLGIAAALFHLPSKLHLDTRLRRKQILGKFLYSFPRPCKLERLDITE